MIFLTLAQPLFAQSVDALLVRDHTFIPLSTRETVPVERRHYLTANARESAFLKFAFDRVLPSDTTAAEIARATLRLYVAFDYVPVREGASRGIAVYGWNDRARDSRPQRDAVATAKAHVPRKGSFFDVDITPLVRAWIAKSRQNDGLVIVGEPVAPGDDSHVAADLRIPSLENPTNAREARLQLVLSRPAAAP